MNCNPSEQVDSLSKRLTILFEEEVFWKSYLQNHYLGFSVYARQGSYCIGVEDSGILRIIKCEDFKFFQADLRNIYQTYNITKGFAHIPSSWKPFTDNFGLNTQSRMLKKEAESVAKIFLDKHRDNTLLVDDSVDNIADSLEGIVNFLYKREKSSQGQALLMMLKAYLKRGENVLENRVI